MLDDHNLERESHSPECVPVAFGYATAAASASSMLENASSALGFPVRSTKQGKKFPLFSYMDYKPKIDDDDRD